MAISRDQINRWGNAPSESNETKCQYTVEQIKRVIRGRFGNDVYIYLQGSYRNRTNVRLDSDVDVVIENPEYYFPDTGFLSEEEKRKYEASRTPATYPFASFKSDVHAALQSVFGINVHRKNKCVRIDKDNYRVNADVVPCYTYKRLSTATVVEAEGIGLTADSGDLITSFPKQHYENGASKNINTDGKFKSVVRVLKNARNQLVDLREILESLMPSFFLECLVWNVPNSDFNSRDLYDTTREIVARLYNDMGDADKARNYSEISDLKWLLRGYDADSKKQSARKFLEVVWSFIGYQN